MVEVLELEKNKYQICKGMVEGGADVTRDAKIKWSATSA